jgi:hypothetical protein
MYNVSANSRVNSSRGIRTTTKIQSTAATQNPSTAGGRKTVSYQLTSGMPWYDGESYNVTEMNPNSESAKLQAKGVLPVMEQTSGGWMFGPRYATKDDYKRLSIRAVQGQGYFADVTEDIPDVPGIVNPVKLKYKREALAIQKEGKQNLVSDENKPESLTSEDVLKKRLSMIRMKGRASIPSSSGTSKDEPTINISSGGAMGLNFA